jgi:hypothetical protein
MKHLMAFMESSSELWQQLNHTEMTRVMAGQEADSFTEKESEIILDLIKRSRKVAEVSEIDLNQKMLQMALFRSSIQSYSAGDNLCYHYFGRGSEWHTGRYVPESDMSLTKNIFIQLFRPKLSIDLYKSTDDWFLVCVSRKSSSHREYYKCDGFAGLLSMINDQQLLGSKK